jgi:predicted phosphodiesterase
MRGAPERQGCVGSHPVQGLAEAAIRLAVIADIHGNVAALEAVLADVKARGADRIVNLGDCVSGPLWPRETMDMLEALALPTVRGNHDRWVAQTPREHMFPSDTFAFDRMTPAQRTALGALPAWVDLGDGIVAVHGTLGDDNQYLLEDIVGGRLTLASSAAIGHRLRGQAAHLVLCGHSHQPRIAHGPRGVLIVNPGSVGCPAYADPTPPAHVSETGGPHARFALLAREGGRWRIDLIAVEYDWNRASTRAADNGRQDWARALATGYAD